MYHPFYLGELVRKLTTNVPYANNIFTHIGCKVGVFMKRMMS
jgi:hypothetical protein